MFLTFFQTGEACFSGRAITHRRTSINIHIFFSFLLYTMTNQFLHLIFLLLDLLMISYLLGFLSYFFVDLFIPQLIH